MTRKSYVQIDGKLYEKGAEPQQQSHFIMGDLNPYQAMATGELIEGRRQHREYLKANQLIEVGNESSALLGLRPQRKADPQRKQQIAAILRARLNERRSRG